MNKIGLKTIPQDAGTEGLIFYYWAKTRPNPAATSCTSSCEHAYTHIDEWETSEAYRIVARSPNISLHSSQTGYSARTIIDAKIGVQQRLLASDLQHLFNTSMEQKRFRIAALVCVGNHRANRSRLRFRARLECQDRRRRPTTSNRVQIMYQICEGLR